MTFLGRLFLHIFLEKFLSNVFVLKSNSLIVSTSNLINLLADIISFTQIFSFGIVYNI